MHVIRTTTEMRERMLRYVSAVDKSSHLAPIVAALSGNVNFLIAPASKDPISIPKRMYRRPFIGLVGDDFVVAEGPAAFHLKTLRKLFASADAIYVMSGSINKAAYEAAAEGARAGLRTVIIETQADEEQSWLDYARRHGPKAARLVVPGAKELRNAA